MKQPMSVFYASILLAVARVASADCTAEERPATAEETKIYADGFALFQQIAPPAPAGWVVRDSPTDGVLKGVCADPGAVLTRWTYVRSFEQTEGVEQRRAEASKRTAAAMLRWQETMQSNVAKLAANQEQMEENNKRMQEFMAARKYDEMDRITADNERLMNERTALMDVSAHDAEMKSIDAAASRDMHASFALTIGEKNRNTGGFKPMPTTVGEGFRQDFDSNGNPVRDLMVIVSPRGAAGNETVVSISGDPERADGLLKAINLQLLTR